MSAYGKNNYFPFLSFISFKKPGPDQVTRTLSFDPNSNQLLLGVNPSSKVLSYFSGSEFKTHTHTMIAVGPYVGVTA